VVARSIGPTPWPSGGRTLDAHTHQLAELIEPFVGEGVAAEFALSVSGHEGLRTQFNSALKLAFKDGLRVRKGHPICIIQIAALSWATTQVPEITAAIQSCLNAWFRSAAQVEFVV
jgi:hypothetical protein